MTDIDKISLNVCDLQHYFDQAVFSGEWGMFVVL